MLHEEQLDVAKRTSFRENLRDEWEQLSTKAETVLIVNTLMLGIAFTMLVRGEAGEVARAPQRRSLCHVSYSAVLNRVTPRFFILERRRKVRAA